MGYTEPGLSKSREIFYKSTMNTIVNFHSVHCAGYNTWGAYLLHWGTDHPKIIGCGSDGESMDDEYENLGHALDFVENFDEVF